VFLTKTTTQQPNN